MKILFTGSSGFLGRNIIPILKNSCEIIKVDTSGFVDYKFNLASTVPYLDQNFETVVHAAGKAHIVPKNKAEEKQFFEVNVNGTRNLCKSLELNRKLKSIVFISTVAVYGLVKGESISEDTPLRGNSAYARSKIEAEALLTDWCRKKGVILSILRPSLIAGPNPPGNLGAMIDGINTGRYLGVGKGITRRSIVMVQDLAKVILLLSKKAGIYNICDDRHPSFSELEFLISSQLGRPIPISIPLNLAKALAICGDLTRGLLPIDSDRLEKLTSTLTFSNERIKKDLGYIPTDVLSNFRIT